MSDCAYSIKLDKETSLYNVQGHAESYRLKVTVTDTTNVDPNIFLYLEYPADPVTGDVRQVFQAVCSPADLSEYPIGAPSGSGPKLFRLASIDLLHRNLSLLEQTWQLIIADRDALIRTLAKLCSDMTVVETNNSVAVPMFLKTYQLIQPNTDYAQLVDEGNCIVLYTGADDGSSVESGRWCNSTAYGAPYIRFSLDGNCVVIFDVSSGKEIMRMCLEGSSSSSSSH